MIQINQNHPLARKLIAAYPLVERGGTLVRDFGKVRSNGTVTGATWQNGMYGTALRFASGSTNRIASGSGNYYAGPYSVAVLFKMGSSGVKARQIFSYFGSGSPLRDNWLEFNTGGNNRIAWGHANSANNSFPQAQWDSNFETDSIHLVMGVFDGTNLRIYADGDIQYKATAVSGVTIGEGSGSFYIGNRISNDRALDGDIYLTYVWNRALTDSDRLKLYADPWCIYKRTPFMQIGNAATAVASTVKHYLTTLGVGS